MKVLVAVKRVVDYNVKVRPKADGSGVETANRVNPRKPKNVALIAAGHG